jgi:molybdopterin-guanine dinucleotide biosynthesis protein A
VKVSAAILAGGRAARFGGRDKSALVVDGRTIVERQLAMLATVTDDVMIVGRERGAEHSAPPAVVDRRGVRFVPDIVPGCGPLGGLHAALSAAHADAVLLIACDMPFVSAPFAAYLLSLAGEAAIVVPRSERGYHPLCAVYTRACLEPVAARLAGRRLRMRELVDEMPARVVSLEEIDRFGDGHRLLANVNTPAEYAGLEALQGHKL